MSNKMMTNMAQNIKKTGKDDPRRIIHCIKVGLALTIVSMLYYFRPLYKGFGQSAVWAVLTVVVVFEYTAGGTLSKSLNRGFATLVAGLLGVGAEYLAQLLGETGEPILLAFLVFLLGAILTFTRFIPHIKKRYDYGVLIFILTFSLVAVSGYRVDQIVEMAHQRLSTILIGGATCILISIFVYPVWAGEDLHNLIANNLAKLADFLEGVGGKSSSVGGKDDKSYLQAYKCVLNSKASEESLANLAWWEPCHGGFRFSHPWKQYLKMGVLTRQCAYLIESLSTCLHSQPQVESEFGKRIEEAGRKMSLEAGKTMREISLSIKSMTCYQLTIETHLKNSKLAMDELKNMLDNLTLDNNDNAKIMDIMQLLASASILIEIIKCVEIIAKSYIELSRLASFKSPPSPVTVETSSVNLKCCMMRVVKSMVVDNRDGDQSVIKIHESSEETEIHTNSSDVKSSTKLAT